jgi:hypothetical protein
MTSLSENPVAKKRGRPAGSKNKTADDALVMSFKRRGRPRLTELPLGASSWQDAYNKTFKNLERAYERLVEFHDVHTKLEQAENDIVGMATIINYLELKLDEAKQKANDERTSI